MRSKDIFVPLTICIDETRRALVIDFPCYGALEIVSVIIISVYYTVSQKNVPTLKRYSSKLQGAI